MQSIFNFKYFVENHTNVIVIISMVPCRWAEMLKNRLPTFLILIKLTGNCTKTLYSSCSSLRLYALRTATF